MCSFNPRVNSPALSKPAPRPSSHKLGVQEESALCPREVRSGRDRGSGSCSLLPLARRQLPRSLSSASVQPKYRRCRSQHCRGLPPTNAEKSKGRDCFLELADVLVNCRHLQPVDPWDLFLLCNVFLYLTV